jgi:hypothetical protein
MPILASSHSSAARNLRSTTDRFWSSRARFTSSAVLMLTSEISATAGTFAASMSCFSTSAIVAAIEVVGLVAKRAFLKFSLFGALYIYIFTPADKVPALHLCFGFFFHGGLFNGCMTPAEALVGPFYPRSGWGYSMTGYGIHYEPMVRLHIFVHLYLRALVVVLKVGMLLKSLSSWF